MKFKNENNFDINNSNKQSKFFIYIFSFKYSCKTIQSIFNN